MKVDQWYSETVYVDADTGESITKYTALKDYKIINKRKKIKIDENAEKSVGIITIVVECRRSTQGKLFE